MKKMAWSDFRDCGLLWWINRSLHLLGWAIVFECSESGEILSVYPAKVSFRGFSETAEEEGFTKLTEHLVSESGRLLKDVNE